MIPPTYFVSQLQAAQRRAREGAQTVPSSMGSESTVGRTDSVFSECVLDLSKYLTSDLPASSREVFDDLFHERASYEALQKPLPGVIKIKDEPDSTATSRCSTPESLLPEHDFDNGEFPTPRFQENNNNVPNNKEGSLLCQLQTINRHGSNQTSDGDSDEEINVKKLDLDAQKLKAALVQLENSSQDTENPGRRGDVSPTHRNTLKAPVPKSRKTVSKGSDEYIVKRERNNVAVRKSRTKAKLKHIETQMRVGELTEENEQLRNRVALLQKELNALKSYITYNCANNSKEPIFSSYPQLFPSTKIM